VHIARLQALDSEKERDLKAILEIAEKALKYINISELLEYCGLKSDTRKDASKIKRFDLVETITMLVILDSISFFNLVVWIKPNLTYSKYCLRRGWHCATCIVHQGA